jgi:hypothetical protein
MVNAYPRARRDRLRVHQELLRFGREQAPRLDRVRARINRIGKRLENQQGREGDPEHD